MNGILGGIFTGLLGNLLNWQLIQGYLRSILLGAGASLVTSGVLTQDQLVGTVGAVLAVLGLIFQAVANNTKAKALAVVKAVDNHPSITVIPAHLSSTGAPLVSVKS